MLASALASDRPAQGLAARVERLQGDLAWAVRPDTPLGEAWPDVRSELDLLVEQIRGEDPEAEETLTRVRALVAGPGGGP